MRICKVACLLAATLLPMLAQTDDFSRDPNQALDQQYTDAINRYTTRPILNSNLTNYLPSSSSVPTPAKVLGAIAGAPDMLPYAEDTYRYFRMLADSTPRVRVYSIGRSEEGREMVAVAVADQALLANLKENDARLAQLSDPRSIAFNDATAKNLVEQSFPIYYITGTIHSTETGAPTALMELAYRLAVDDSPYIKYIRSHMVTLITPVVEVDGRDRMVDLYKWHKAHPGENYPRLAYWGHYVAHDNNRDAMAMTLALTNHVLDTYLGWHAQVLHDLHESVPFLYDNTVGDGPYNAWIDPLLSDEWAALAWNNVGEMQTLGMPGVFTHGDFDTWSPGYLMFLAGLHNGISRLYETFGNGGADTLKRILTPQEYSRTWYRQNPPLPSVTWSQRDNNNYEETALLTTLSYFSRNAKHFLDNYYLKSKRSIQKPENAGPAAYVFLADETARNRQIQLLKVMAAQHVEISQLKETVTVNLPPPAHPPDAKETSKDGSKDGSKEDKPKPTTQTFPAGSYVIRMDQPFSRVADALLDRQYWSPNDPQKQPYDDTGWSFGELFNAKAVRIVDRAILSAKMDKVSDPDKLVLPLSGTGALYAVNNSAQVTLASLAYAMKGSDMVIAEKEFEDGTHKFAAGSLIIGNVDSAKLGAALRDFSLEAYALATRPDVPTHKAMTPRIAFMHTWQGTQTEGWWRIAFDKLHVPYEYISTQTVAQESDLRSKFDVIIFAPLGGGSSGQIIQGLPMWGNPMPWKKTELTPNLGLIDSTDDMRPGLGYSGVDHLRAFLEGGGLLITAEDTAEFAIQAGLTPGVFEAPRKNIKVVGTVLGGVVVDKSHPVAYGYSGDLAFYSADGRAFTVGNMAVNRHIETEKDYKRPTGRGGPDEDDAPESRPGETPEPLPSPKAWEPTPLNEEQARNNPYVLPAEYRPNVIFRFADNKGLLLSGLLEGGDAIAQLPAVVDAHLGKGNVLLFAINPVYRGETIGTYAMVFSALLNFDHMGGASNKTTRP
jgi:hypothetical protein